MSGICRRGGPRSMQAVSYRARTTETHRSGPERQKEVLPHTEQRFSVGLTNYRFHNDFMCDIEQSRESTDLAHSSLGFMNGIKQKRRSSTWTRAVGSFVSDETGQDLIEYALLAGSIGLVGIAMWDGIVTGIGNGYQGWDTNTQARWHPLDPTP